MSGQVSLERSTEGLVSPTPIAPSRLLAEPIDGCPLTRWADRSEDTVLCETVRRTKGIERTAVVLADVIGEPDPVLLCVGVSRAVAVLRLVGPKPSRTQPASPRAPPPPRHRPIGALIR